MVLVVQSLSRVRLFVTPWTAAHQASLSLTVSQSLLKLMSIESVMPPSHPLLFSSPAAFSLSKHQGSFSVSQPFTSGDQSIGGSASASVLPVNIQDWLPLRLTGLISFAVQETLKSLLERLLLNHERRQDSCPPKKKSVWGERWGLISLSFCVIKFY